MSDIQFLALLRNRLADAPPPADVDWAEMVRIADRHELLFFLEKYADNMPPQLADSLEQRWVSLMAQHLAQMQAVEDMQAALEKAGVDYLFFKGTVTKKRYPDPMLRTMGDIDVLYRPNQQTAFRAVMEAMGYGDFQAGRKNDTYWKRPLVCVEAHRRLIGADSRYAEYCDGVWERAKPVPGLSHGFEMAVEDEFLFNVIHLAKHLSEGGAGVRFILDVFIYHHLPMDESYVQRVLEALGLTRFYTVICQLADHWFAGKDCAESVEKLGEFMLQSRVFGSARIDAALQIQQGRLRYIWKTCFPGYREMCSMYPWLGGKAALLPVAWGMRGVTLLFRRGRVAGVMRTVCSGDKQAGQELQEMYRACGLE